MALKPLLNSSEVGDSMLDTFTLQTLADTSLSSTKTNMTVTVSDAELRYEECPWEVTSCQVQRYLFLVIAPILVVLATIGNSLGLAVMRRKALRQSATAVFISALAISDMVAVWTGLSRHFVKKLTAYDIRQYSEWTCRFQRFTLYLALDSSAWILGAISIERFLAVCMPLQHRAFKVRSRALKIVLGIILFQTAYNCPVFFTYGEQTFDNKTYPCSFTSDAAKTYHTKYNTYISMVIYCVFPSVVMLTLNICIIVRLIRIEKSFLRNATTTSRSQINAISMTRMLLCVTFYFIIVTTPSFIFAIFQEKLFAQEIVTPEDFGQSEVVDAIFTLLLYLNHSINFFLYCATGKKFKRELLKMLGCYKFNRDRKQSERTTTCGTPLMMRSVKASPSVLKKAEAKGPTSYADFSKSS
ncbi:FMRFamide peptide receptor frpr-18-like [Watersipora subatra]|uniref:FMRFamide peptide receptor frpr-18-like n=1 Tax=Watersipora subatra TaxID=2589382 RepID=UPI00355C201A